MSELLSEEWFADAASTLAAQPPAGDVAATVQYVVSGGPSGKVTAHAVVTGGVVQTLALGKAADPDVVVSCDHATARAVLAGEKSADVAFMDASVKVEGHHRVWLLDLRDVRAAALAALRD